jgi:hypothetical protein
LIRHREKEILRLHAEYSQREETPSAGSHRPPALTSRSDAKVIEQARSEKNGKFDRLFRGDTSDFSHDHSAADDGFVHKLYSYTQDEEQIRGIHATSGLHRPEKSGRRPDYLRRSIERARRNVTWFYDWLEPSEKDDAADNLAVRPSKKPGIGELRQDTVNPRALESEEAVTLSDRPIGSVFGQNELLPLKTPKEIVEAAQDSTDWIVEGILARGEITDLAGKAKHSGKTTFINHMLKAVISGDEFIGLTTRKAKVLYLTEQGNNFANALKKSGLEDEQDALCIVQYRDLHGKNSRWNILINAATKVCNREGFEVLVVDTFAGLSGLRGTEENNVGDILEKMAPLKAAAQKDDLAVIVARHAGKDGKGRGSSIFEGEADIVLTLGRPEGNHKETARVLEGIGRHDDIPAKITIELTDEGYVSLGGDDKVEFGRALKALREMLPQNPDEAMEESAILDHPAFESISRTTARSALKSLMRQGDYPIKRKGEGKKGNPYRYWQLPID